MIAAEGRLHAMKRGATGKRLEHNSAARDAAMIEADTTVGALRGDVAASAIVAPKQNSKISGFARYSNGNGAKGAHSTKPPSPSNGIGTLSRLSKGRRGGKASIEEQLEIKRLSD